MILVDTSVWISFLRKDDPDLVDILRKYLNRDEVLGCSAVFGELLQGVRSKREKDVVYALWEALPAAVESQAFLKAGEISNRFNLLNKGVGLIDCYILSVALENQLTLWTLDKKLKQAYEQILDD